MNKLIFITIISSVIVLSMFSCSTSYIPTMSNVPLHDKKGDGQVSAGVSTNSVHLSANYAFTDKLALQFNGNMSFRNYSNKYDLFTSNKSSRKFKFISLRANFGEFAHQYWEIGGGRYNILKSNWKLEAFTGVGYGKAVEKAEDNLTNPTTRDTDRVEDINSHYYLGYAQANFGRKTKSNKFEFGFSLRLAYSNFYFSDFEASNPTPYITFNNLSAEPLFFLKFGTDYLKYYFKTGYTFLKCLTTLDNFDLERGIIGGKFNYTHSHFSVGLSYMFGKKPKDKKNITN